MTATPAERDLPELPEPFLLNRWEGGNGNKFVMLPSIDLDAIYSADQMRDYARAALASSPAVPSTGFKTFADEFTRNYGRYPVAADAWAGCAALGAPTVPSPAPILTAWCCEEGRSAGVAMCKACVEASAGYSAAMLLPQLGSSGFDGSAAYEVHLDASSRASACSPAVPSPAPSLTDEPDDEDAQGNHAGVVAGFSRHKYRQGTRECVAFVNGARWWHERTLAAPVAAQEEGCECANCANGMGECQKSVAVQEEAEPVAWLKSDGSDAWTDARKRHAIESQGAGGKMMAAQFDRPLHLHPPREAEAADGFSQAEARAKRIEDVAVKYASRTEHGEVIFPGQSWMMFAADLATELEAGAAAPDEGRKRGLLEAAEICDRLCVALDNTNQPYRREASAARCAAAIREHAAAHATQGSQPS